MMNKMKMDESLLNRYQRLNLWRQKQAKLSNNRIDAALDSFDELPWKISNYNWLGGTTLEPLKAISNRIASVTLDEVSNNPNVAHSILLCFADLFSRLAHNLEQEKKIHYPSVIKSFTGQLNCS